MNAELLRRLNAKVKPTDVLLHAGDLWFPGKPKKGQTHEHYAQYVAEKFIAEIRPQIEVRDLRLMVGNHDEWLDTLRELSLENDSFADLRYKLWSDHGTTILERDIFALRVPEYSTRLIVSHYPILAWHGMNRGIGHCHGHIHSSVPLSDPDCRRLDIGVDGNDYEPWSIPEIQAALADIPAKEHHT